MSTIVFNNNTVSCKSALAVFIAATRKVGHDYT